MERITKIKTSEVNIGSKLILNNNKEAIVKGYINSMLPTIDEVYEFDTNIGKVLPNEVKEIIGGN
ncbi:hypothetical protein [uncultured Clostridium sp.]|uniref:hypothetical protein n=1 Tax=uncultured Clostridium sp. TaxID=59620 RepID=UPI002638F47B|nr:hypothetical protein [uncultured Clostridium sp.]